MSDDPQEQEHAPETRKAQRQDTESYAEPARPRDPDAPLPEPEQLGSLTFVPNPDYPYPFKVPTPPHFWMEETTGVLNDAVETYMNGEKLAPEQFDAIKTYLRQFIERAVLTGDANKKQLLTRIDKLKTTGDIERFADQVSEYGAEVF